MEINTFLSFYRKTTNWYIKRLWTTAKIHQKPSIITNKIKLWLTLLNDRTCTWNLSLTLLVQAESDSIEYITLFFGENFLSHFFYNGILTHSFKQCLIFNWYTGIIDLLKNETIFMVMELFNDINSENISMKYKHYYELSFV